MGSFEGHCLPGTVFLLVGIPLLIRSINVSLVIKYRFSKLWILWEAILKTFAGSIGFLVEFCDMMTSNSSAMSHKEHLRMYSAIGIIGILDLLHIYKILKDNFWIILNPLLFAFVGLMFMGHEQETDLRTIEHNMIIVLFLMIAFSRMIEILISLYLNKEHFENDKETKIIENNSYCGRKIFCFLSNHNLNLIYTNPIVYSTIFPMLTATLIILNGLWWWQMAINFYLDSNIDYMMETGHHAISSAYAIMYYLILITISITMAISFILHKIDKISYKNKSINQEEMNLIINN